MENRTITQEIERGGTALGIELGSTRIRAVLIGPDHTPLAAGSHDWENECRDGIWTYSLDEVTMPDGTCKICPSGTHTCACKR